jgi:DNA-binding IclR family transcriptional regulator
MPKQIQSIERALFILESIMFNDEPVTGTELARRLGVHKSTVSHLTATLVEQGYLCKVPGSSKLATGPKLYRAGRMVGLSGDQIIAVPPVLAELAAETGETAHVAELRGRYVIFLENQYPKKALRVQTETGSVEAAHSTAVGKALLAGLEDDEVRGLLGEARLESFTDKTITDVGGLLIELANVKDRGYAADRGEQTPGTGCIAAPVHDARGMTVAAVGISGPEDRVFDDEKERAGAVVECAGKIDELLRG